MNPSNLVTKLTAELIGTFLLTFCILSSVQNMILLGTPHDFFLVCITHGLILCIVAFIYGPISEGHVNPAVTFAFLLRKKIDIVTFGFYVAAQMVGAFLASGVVYLVFLDQLKTCDNSCCGLCNEPASVGQVWSGNGTLVNVVSESVGVNMVSAFTAEVIGTFLLILAVISTDDEKNSGVQESSLTKVILISAAITLPGTCLGKLTGFAINPARDFAPRLFSAIVFGPGALTVYSWVPVIAPMVGSLLAVLVKKVHEL